MNGLESAPMDGQPRIEVAVEEGRTILALGGIVGIAHIAEFHLAAKDLVDAAGPVWVDCAEVVHLDTAAIQVLLALRGARERLGRAFELVRVPARVAGYLRAAGMTGLLLRKGD